MATRETRRERGRRQAEQRLARVVNELRVARQTAAISQSALALDAGWSQSELHRLERLEFSNVSLPRPGALASTLGFEVSLTIHPVGDALRDKGQQALIARFTAVVHPTFAGAAGEAFRLLLGHARRHAPR